MKAIQFGGLSNSLAESVESSGNAWASFNAWHDGGILEGMRRYKVIGNRSSFNTGDVAYGLGYGKYAANGRQRIEITGAPTGGTFTLTFSGQTTGNLNRTATAADVQAKLEALSNIEVGDVICTGGPLPGIPIEVEFLGQFARTNVAAMTGSAAGLTGGSSPAIVITELARGGDHEVFYAVVKHSGDTDSNLYAVTSSDGFATTTWTSVSTSMDSTDWYFQQYGPRMFFVNATDGLKWLYIGTPTLGATPPLPPGTAPTAVETHSTWPSTTAMIRAADSVAVTGPSVASTVTMWTYGTQVVLNSTETGVDLVVTVTFAADKDWSLGRDVGQWILGTNYGGSGAVSLNFKDATIEIVNADGSPVTIVPDYVSRALFQTGTGYSALWKVFHFADEQRGSRDNVHKVIFRFPNSGWLTGDTFDITAYLNDTWPNDTRSLRINPPDGETDPPVTKATIDYAYSYYDTSEGLESALSPFTTSQVLPASGVDGCYVVLTAVGSTQLDTVNDRVFFYRKEKGTNKWRRLPNTATVVGTASYGATNATASSPTMNDTWMEHELAGFPEYSGIGFPPNNTGVRADCIGVWKQCLAIGSFYESYLSWVGQPLKYEPSPSTPGYVSPDPDEFPDVGVTEFVSDNRGELVNALIGQDPLYAVTDASSYAKIGGSPATSSVYRRLPGSRGSVGKRASYRYGDGVLNIAQDGLWFYQVSTGFKGENTGSLYEREETGGDVQKGIPGVRRSFDRLISELQSITLSGTYTSTDTMTFTVGGKTAAWMPVNSCAYVVQRAIEALDNVNAGDIEVFGQDLIDPDSLLPGGKMYFRFIGQFKNTNVDPITITLASSGLTATVKTESAGGTGDDTIVCEHNDEYWLFNNNNYLVQSRNRKWVEGTLFHKIKAAAPTRLRGLVCLTGEGFLVRFLDGQTTDAGVEVRWFYETPWMYGPRSRITQIVAGIDGTVNLRILSDDGAGSVDSYKVPTPRITDITLRQDKYAAMKSVTLPGKRHKFILSGITGQDAVRNLEATVESVGGELGS